MPSDGIHLDKVRRFITVGDRDDFSVRSRFALRKLRRLFRTKS